MSNREKFDISTRISEFSASFYDIPVKSLTTGKFHARIGRTMTHQRNTRTRVQEYLPRLKSRELTNREVAELLGVNEQHLSRVLSEIGFEKDPPVDRAAAKAENAKKKARIKELALSDLDPKEAAKQAGVSERTIYRYRNK